MSDEIEIGEKTLNNDQIADNEGTNANSKDNLELPNSLTEGPVQPSGGELIPPEDSSKLETGNSVIDKIKEKLKEDLENENPPEADDAEMDLNVKENEDRGVKRRASTAFSDEGDEEFKGFGQDEPSFIPDYNRVVENVEGAARRESTSSDTTEEFKGFESSDQKNLSGYNQALDTPLTPLSNHQMYNKRTKKQHFSGPDNWERLEAELSEAVKGFTPLKTVMAVPSVVRASKRSRQDTDGSRPSSALSSRSEGEGAVSTDVSHGITLQIITPHYPLLQERNSLSNSSPIASMSPAGRGRRPTTEMSSPLLRVPLERGWRRELVYRAAQDAHSRRAADIYYYTPAGKKLRSMREIAEVLSGTGLTIENFSFFKEPLGIDDPEKETIRDAKMLRRVESPVPAVHTPTVVEGKRTPKPKPPKGASPEPTTPKSPPAKIKVKSMGSRLSNSGTPTPKPVRKPQPAPPAPPAPSAPLAAPDNNNTAAWKKPRGAPPPLQPRPAPPAPPPAPPPPLAPHRPSDAPPPTHAPPHTHGQSAAHATSQQRYRMGQAQQPCSMSCGRGAVPSLACGACLCLYHPACVGAPHHITDFLCKNCRKTTSPPLEPPSLTHKSGVSGGGATGTSGSQGARRLPVPVPVPVPVPAKVPRPEKRPVPRMKTSGVVGGAAAGSAWAAATGPQSLAVLNGRRFIVVARPTNT